MSTDRFWPVVADQEPRISGFSVSGERQLLAESTHSATKIGLDDPNAYFRPNIVPPSHSL